MHRRLSELLLCAFFWIIWRQRNRISFEMHSFFIDFGYGLWGLMSFVFNWLCWLYGFLQRVDMSFIIPSRLLVVPLGNCCISNLSFFANKGQYYLPFFMEWWNLSFSYKIRHPIVLFIQRILFHFLQSHFKNCYFFL